MKTGTRMTLACLVLVALGSAPVVLAQVPPPTTTVQPVKKVVPLATTPVSKKAATPSKASASKKAAPAPKEAVPKKAVTCTTLEDCQQKVMQCSADNRKLVEKVMHSEGEIPYLGAAYMALWAVVFFFVFRWWRRQKQLELELVELEARLLRLGEEKS